MRSGLLVLTYFLKQMYIQSKKMLLHSENGDLETEHFEHTAALKQVYFTWF